MSDSTQGADSGPDSSTQSDFKEYVVKRDNDGPYSFAGVLLAKASRQSGAGVIGMGSTVELEAAVYRTRGGKFITSLSKKTTSAIKLSALLSIGDDDDDPSVNSAYRKAAVHDSFEEAVCWFRPGKLTDEIRRQLGLDKPVRIE